MKRGLLKSAACGVVGGLACALVIGLLAAYEDAAVKRDVRERFDDLGDPDDVVRSRSNVVRGGWDR